MTSGNLTIREALAKGRAILKNGGVDSFAVDASALMKRLLLKDDVFLAVHRDLPLTPTQADTYLAWLRRRAAGEPLAYITGEREFLSLPFFVEPGVLIPRPDTETLVESLLALRPKRASILDLCTGSGAVAVSLAYHLPDASVFGADISQKALAVAEKNAARNGVADRTTFFLCDVLHNLPAIGRTFDMVAANPPYIRSNEINSLMRDVRDYEPHLALDGGADGLVFYRAILRDIPSILPPGGRLAFEIGFDQGQAVSQLMQDGFYKIEIVNDLAGQNRVVTGLRR